MLLLLDIRLPEAGIIAEAFNRNPTALTTIKKVVMLVLKVFEFLLLYFNKTKSTNQEYK